MTTTSSKKASPVRRRPWLLIALAVVVLGGAIWGIASLLGNDLPRLNDNAVVLTKFIRSGRFDALPFEQRRQFYKVLDDRDAELDEAYQSKRLSESEFRAGLEAAWLGKHINRVEKYFSLPPGQGRTAYINKLLDKKERKKAKSTSGGADIDADETAAELRVESWPSAARSQWDQFHDAYRQQKKTRESAKQPQTKPVASTG
jgi:hypothetical protein